MRRVWRVTKWLFLGVALTIAALLSPVAYVETMCRSNAPPAPYKTLVAAEYIRPETRTLMTYPEWHIVHAYEDYARVIAVDDPHAFAYLRAVGGFWSSLCSLQSAALGEIDGPTKQMVYVIGVSFTAELLLKAAYEETFGHLFAALRGPDRSVLDRLSAQQAAAYAAFLQQVPWYKWRFREDRAALAENTTGSLRDRERQFALGTEYGVKAAYADVIAKAVAQVGQDQLTLRMIVKTADRAALQSAQGVTVIADRPEGIEIETPRYRALTNLLNQWALSGMDFVEIAGNDDILFTVISDLPTMEGAFFSEARQGTADYRHLVMTKVSQLAQDLRNLQHGERLEHIHDY